MQIPISSIKGTGPEGLIVKGDIDDYLGITFCLAVFCTYSSGTNYLLLEKSSVLPLMVALVYPVLLG